MKTIAELNEIKAEALAKIELRQEEQKEISDAEKTMELDSTHVMVCGGTGCTSAGGEKIRQLLVEKVEEKGIKDIEIVLTGCLGLCEAGPNIVVYPEGIFYSHVKLEDVDEIVEEHFQKGNIVKRLLFEDSYKDGVVKPINDVDFYKKQSKVALRNCGIINPEDIDEYIALDGYQALGKVLTEMDPKEVIELVKDSNLRGRGGGGFPTGLKWENAFKSEGNQKYVICNGDEGGPGAFMDSSILGGDPHSILEAMAICGYAIGSNQGYIHVRVEYPLAIKRLKIAIDQAKEKGFLGKNIFGTDFNFDIELKYGAGAFVCGESTALLEAMEGKRAIPRAKVYRTSHKGLWQKPTIINNVETLANIPVLFQKGLEWFKGNGTENSPGTKIFGLGGKVKNAGLVEVSMDLTFKDIIFDIGGGIPKGKEFKAVQTGGPTGGFIPAKYQDSTVDYDSLIELGSIMGSGGLIVMDEDDCVVDMAKLFLDFSVEESCGKCVPCREGTKRMLEILERITEGDGVPEDIETLEKLSTTMTVASLCGLGQTAAKPVTSTLKYFRDEYEAHINDKTCPAGSCKELLEYYITDACIGCTKCARNCPVSCIAGKVKEMHVIDAEACIKCGVCMEVCPVDAVIMR